MIPGNRPEDVADDRFWEELDRRFTKQYGEAGIKWLTLLEDLDPEDLIIEYIRVACDIAWEDGYNLGVNDAYMEMSAKEESEH